MELEIIRRVEELPRLKEAWAALAERAESPMQTRAWAEAAARAFASRYTPELMCLGGADHPLLIAALGRRRADPLWRLELLGAEELTEPSDFVAADPSALHEFAAALYDHGAPLFFKRVLADSPALAAVQRRYQGRGITVVRSAGAIPWLPLDDGKASPEDRLNTGRRSDLRRALRKAEQLGAVEFTMDTPAPEALGPLLDEALSVEASGWKGRSKSALFFDLERQEFFRNYAAAVCPAREFLVGMMRVGGRAAAMQLATVHRRRLWILKIGYSEQYKSCSPGALLMLETIRYAMKHELSAVELLGFEEAWTKMWTERARPCVALRAYPPRPRALARLAAEVAEKGYQRLRTWR